MVVNMCGPSAIKGDKTGGVDRAYKDVLRHEISFAPEKELSAAKKDIGRMAALAYALKPVPVRVVAVLEPFVDQDVSSIVIEFLADEFAHGQGGRKGGGIPTGFEFACRHFVEDGEGKSENRDARTLALKLSIRLDQISRVQALRTAASPTRVACSCSLPCYHCRDGNNFFLQLEGCFLL